MGLNLNNIVVSGRLANDSETRSTREGRLVTSFGIYVIYRLSRDQRTGEWQEDGFWLNVEKWEPQNSQPRQYMKGDEVVVVGKLREHVWQSNDGRDMRSMRLVAQNGGYGYGQPTPPPAAPRQYGAPAPAPSPVAQYAKQQQAQQQPQPPPPDVTDDDLPF